MTVILEAPSVRRRAEFLSAVRRSRKLHASFAKPPATPKAFAEMIRYLRSKRNVGHFVCLPSGEIVGVVNLSEMVWGSFRSAYLGYYAFSPHDGRGYMKEAIRRVVTRAFGELGLHRVEANIQPNNLPSRALVRGLGFRREGFSLRYLKIDGRWRDHERWAITAEEWKPRRAGAGASKRPGVATGRRTAR